MKLHIVQKHTFRKLLHNKDITSLHTNTAQNKPLSTAPKNVLQNISGYTTGRLWAIYNQGDICDLSSLSGRLSQRMTDGRTDVIALHLKENRG